MRNLLAFIGWIFKQSTRSLREFNEGYRDFMEETPGGAVIIGILVSVIVFIALILIVTFSLEQYGMRPNFWIVMSCILPQLSYVVYTGFSLMYNAFEADRAEIFNILKNKE
jgi:hypothetical protein